LYQREADYLIECEWARTSDDIVLRRSKLALHMSPAEQASLHQYVSKHSRAATRASFANRSELA
jgi:glycerol-3-phosphate dehydrogenase